MQPVKQVEKDVRKLENRQVKAGAYSETIIREQEEVIKQANKGIEKANSDLKSLRQRLQPYAGKRPRPMDDKYSDLKFKYERRLKERATLEYARSMAEESITAAKLHMIPGETTREAEMPVTDKRRKRV